MPDGTIETSYLVFAAMHKRLVEYGLCWIRGGPGKSEHIVQMRDKKTGELHEILLRRGLEDEYQFKPREWSQPEINAAGRIHRNIIRLPLHHSIVLQVFYGEWVAECWDGINHDTRAAILRDLTHWRGRPKGVNARLHDANKARGTNVPGIWPGALMDLRDDGIRMLINIERRLKVSQPNNNSALSFKSRT